MSPKTGELYEYSETYPGFAFTENLCFDLFLFGFFLVLTLAEYADKKLL